MKFKVEKLEKVFIVFSYDNIQLMLRFIEIQGTIKIKYYD